MYLEKALASLASASTVVLADGFVAADGAELVGVESVAETGAAVAGHRASRHVKCRFGGPAESESAGAALGERRERLAAWRWSAAVTAVAGRRAVVAAATTAPLRLQVVLGEQVRVQLRHAPAALHQLVRQQRRLQQLDYNTRHSFRHGTQTMKVATFYRQQIAFQKPDILLSSVFLELCTFQCNSVLLLTIC